jgi:hypothetical protein
MSTTAIDSLTNYFYDTISFKNSVVPDINTLHTIFQGSGLMIDNSDEIPVLFTAESYVQRVESQIALGEVEQFTRHEIYAQTEIFGKVAQRLSVYEYNFADHEQARMPRGINFIQYVNIAEQWHITSMAWNDENENYQIPEEYLV